MWIQITKRDVFWSYASYILQTSASFFLLPIILNKLPSDELAIWYVFLSITALVNLLDFGLQPTIMRNVSYIFSGARQLLKEGIIIQEEDQDGGVDYSLLKSLIKTVKKVYMIVAFMIAITMFSVGSIYIKSITAQLSNQNQILNAWYIYIASITLNFYFYYYTPLLLGRGKIAESNQTLVVSKLSFLLISGVGLFLGYNLMAVAVGNLISSFVNRVTSYYFFYDNKIKICLKKSRGKEINLLPVLWSNAYKLGLVSIGAFLINKGNTLIASKYLDLETVAKYGLSLQIITLLSTVSSIFFRTYIPKFNNNRMLGRIENIKKDYSKSLFVMNILYFSGGLIVLFLGNIILGVLRSNTLLLPNIQVFILLIIIYLETNHSNCATLITTKNEVPFVKAALVSGIGVLVLAVISVNYLNAGIMGLILSQGIVQLAYNNWKWPTEMCKDLKTNYLEITKLGFILWKDCFWCNGNGSYS